ncbi:DUF2851 family protein [candidate division KSB1 bacterium]|nr:DUF2851 family protein [candidate division KSB1 bacterium]NIR69227.1 DUF2851 family protein [candidate division KSB1 bacterium]NIS27401.1 DUF2851 family protein [candidate division KSB1 bacterium]NIT74226.1 DUF2851 family protein [candidate division KSB1 bacterium]NIU28118.1 DUF2851 family protein [candidate division KSB1 bacterium]
MELKIHDQEILLQKLWKTRKLFNQVLVSTTGQEIEVVFAGRENFDTGPDFKDAIIRIDGQLLKGDVEVHLEESGWYEHGHHQDPRYNHVILHLISEAADRNSVIEREDGVRVHQLHIDSPELKLNLWKREDSDESKARPPALVVENCPLSQTDSGKIFATINEAGYRRFHQKAAQMREERTSISWDQVLYKNILESLGYSKNQVPFRKLADLLPYETVFEEMQWVSEEMAIRKCAALLFGTAGMLPSQTESGVKVTDKETLDYVGALEYLWNELSHRLQIKPMKLKEWQFFRLRPQNFPTRRIAGTVYLLKKLYRQGFLDGFLRIVSGNADDYDKIITELESVLMVRAEGFWTNHFKFDDEPQTNVKDAALIGKQRARDIVINIVMPVLYLYSIESDDGTLTNTVRELLARYPKLAQNSVTRAMKTQLFGNQRIAIKSALEQQGMIHVHKMFCKPLKCEECLKLSEAENGS